MSLLFNSIISFLLFGLFGWTHSLLASRKVKEKVRAGIGYKIAFYRLFYNSSSVVILIAIFAIAPKPDIMIYDLPAPFDIFILILQTLSAVGFFWSARFVDLKEFLGISQVIRYFNGEYDPSDLDERTSFIVQGAFGYSRHPIYFFSILILLFRPVVYLFGLIILISFTLYFIIGAFFEERKMIERYGEEYVKYKDKVPMFIPVKLFWNKK